MKRYQMTKQPNGSTEQLLIRPTIDTHKNLEAAADESSRRLTKNQVALEIIELYLPLWVELERRRSRQLQEQYRAALGNDLILSPPDNGGDEDGNENLEPGDSPQRPNLNTVTGSLRQGGSQDQISRSKSRQGRKRGGK